jgi:hypothetical protein
VFYSYWSWGKFRLLGSGTSLKGEIIPFLLRACPKLKSLGHGGSIPYGLELFAALQVL